jgi:hypothetical protein
MWRRTLYSNMLEAWPGHALVRNETARLVSAVKARSRSADTAASLGAVRFEGESQVQLELYRMV